MFHQNRPSRKPVMNLSPGEAWLRDCFPPESVGVALDAAVLKPPNCRRMISISSPLEKLL